MIGGVKVIHIVLLALVLGDGKEKVTPKAEPKVEAKKTD
jgi:hypothetical protein